MKKRLEYLGYDTSDHRNVSGKLRSFHSALKNSYQAEWITVNPDTEKAQKWRCLINSSRLTEEFDKKVLSIDFESEVKEGSVFWWDRTKKYWMIDLQQHTEEAYFRGTITRADYDINADSDLYHAIVKGPSETTTEWENKHQIIYNNLNYTLALRLEKNNKTVSYFTRHKVVEVTLRYPNKETGEEMEETHKWKVVATDKYSSGFLIDVYLDEWYDNKEEDAEVDPTPAEPDVTEPHIEGSRLIHGFDTDLLYSIVGLTNGKWVVSSNKVKIVQGDEASCVLEILTGKPCNFTLSYIAMDGTKVEQEIVIR